jgi:hypothetical protein
MIHTVPRRCLTEPEFLICKFVSPRIDSKEPIPPGSLKVYKFGLWSGKDPTSGPGSWVVYGIDV